MTDQHSAGIIRVLQRVQDSIKKQADECTGDGFPDEVALMNLGRLDAVIETLGGQSSWERWND